jgi:hypothetical protein
MQTGEAEVLVGPEDASSASAPAVKLTQKERKAAGKAAKRAIRDEEDRVRLAKRAAMHTDKSEVLLTILQLTPLLSVLLPLPLPLEVSAGLVATTDWL